MNKGSPMWLLATACIPTAPACATASLLKLFLQALKTDQVVQELFAYTFERR
jgi:hypothetical protein